MYNISNHTLQQAKKYNLQVKPSTNKKKKLDVYKDNKKVATIGDINYKDYGIYLKEKGKEYADKRRELYNIRHKKDINNVGSNGYYAGLLLW